MNYFKLQKINKLKYLRVKFFFESRRCEKETLDGLIRHSADTYENMKNNRKI